MSMPSISKQDKKNIDNTYSITITQGKMQGDCPLGVNATERTKRLNTTSQNLIQLKKKDSTCTTDKSSIKTG